MKLDATAIAIIRNRIFACADHVRDRMRYLRSISKDDDFERAFVEADIKAEEARMEHLKSVIDNDSK